MVIRSPILFYSFVMVIQQVQASMLVNQYIYYGPSTELTGAGTVQAPEVEVLEARRLLFADTVAKTIYWFALMCTTHGVIIRFRSTHRDIYNI